MLLHIANFFEADRRSAIANGDIDLGAVIKMSGTSSDRLATQVTDADAAALDAGNYGIAFKVSNNPQQVTSSEVPVEVAGSRIVVIEDGDQMVEVRRGAIVEYDISLLDASLTTAGAFNGVIGQELAIKDGKFCKNDVVGAITAPVIARVYNIVGGKPRIELV